LLSANTIGVPQEFRASIKDRRTTMITRAMVFLGVISVVLASSGCAMEWVRMDAAAPPFGATHAGCRAQAGEHWPVRNEVATRTVYEDQRVPCRLDEVCAIDGKYNMVPMPKEESYIAGAGWQQQLIWFNRR
jgi:hypothetical protein